MLDALGKGERAGRHGSLGLGLQFARGIAEAHQGSFTTSSDVAGKFAITLTVPA
jgi:signal transduction histidine kinase